MLPEQLPECICGAQAWEPHGTQIGYGSTEAFSCTVCKRPNAVLIFREGGNAFLLPEHTMEDVVEPYVNNVLIPTWKDRACKLKAIHDAMADYAHGIFCDQLGLERGTKIDDLDADQRRKMRDFFDKFYNDPNYRTPAGFEQTILPPRLPIGLTAYVHDNDGQWRHVDRKETLGLNVPMDPDRIREDQFFARIFGALKRELNIDFDVEEVKNQYGSNSQVYPWRRFQIGHTIFTVGPRKRVWAIKLVSMDGLPTDEIRAAAGDNTFSVSDSINRALMWQDDARVARQLEVHAWTEEQLLQFLTILGRESLSAVTVQ